MSLPPKRPAGWRRFIFYRTESLRTTWAFRASVLVVSLAVILGTRAWWEPAIGSSLICNEAVAPSDVLLVENFDPDYEVFERAATLHGDGIAPRVVVPVLAESDGVKRAVAMGTAELMAKLAHLPSIELVPLEVREPITLNAARQLRQFLSRRQVTSITVVAPTFRSRRSQLVYGAILPSAGITVRCVPVVASVTPHNWTATWHGIQEVALQFLKLQYYRFYVMPMNSGD